MPKKRKAPDSDDDENLADRWIGNPFHPFFALADECADGFAHDILRNMPSDTDRLVESAAYDFDPLYTRGRSQSVGNIVNGPNPGDDLQLSADDASLVGQMLSILKAARVMDKEYGRLQSRLRKAVREAANKRNATVTLYAAVRRYVLESGKENEEKDEILREEVRNLMPGKRLRFY